LFTFWKIQRTGYKYIFENVFRKTKIIPLIPTLSSFYGFQILTVKLARTTQSQHWQCLSISSSEPRTNARESSQMDFRMSGSSKGRFWYENRSHSRLQRQKLVAQCLDLPKDDFDTKIDLLVDYIAQNSLLRVWIFQRTTLIRTSIFWWVTMPKINHRCPKLKRKKHF